MWQGLIIATVVLLWQMLSFVDSYLDGKLATQVGRVAIVAIAAISWLSPGAFAAGTKRFVDAEAKALTEWFTESLSHIFEPPVSVEPHRLASSTRPLVGKW